MKTICTLILGWSMLCIGYSQDYYSDFEDLTLQGWTDYNATTTGMSVQGEQNFRYLQKICDATATATGSMTIVNTQDFNGDYNCYDPQGINCFGNFEILVRNPNPFDLHLRLGFVGANSTLLVTEFAKIIPANTDWTYESFNPDASELTMITGTGTIEAAMVDVQEVRIFHNPTITWIGAFETGNLEIDYIWLLQLLNTDAFSLRKTALFLNPTNDVLTVSLSRAALSELVVYNLLGQEIFSLSAATKHIAIPVSELNSGVYLVCIKAEGQLITRKIVKR